MPRYCLALGVAALFVVCTTAHAELGEGSSGPEVRALQRALNLYGSHLEVEGVFEKETRRAVRELIEERGAFIEIHVATTLAVCESRDRKGLYAKARKGIIPEFTGISDPYDIPQAPELRLDTSSLTPAQAVQEVLLYLFREGFIDEC